MMYSIVKDGVIDNNILLDNPSDWQVPEGCSLIESNDYAIGGSYVNGVYTAPPEPDPIPVVITTVTPRQARLALLNAGLLDQVEAAVTQAGGATKITWDYATEINRNDPMVAAIAQQLSLTDQQIDDLFTQAATL